jgi:hypothetical protein
VADDIYVGIQNISRKNSIAISIDVSNEREDLIFRQLAKIGSRGDLNGPVKITWPRNSR